MLRLTEIKLPLVHAEGEIRTAILKRLALPDDALLSYVIFKRGVDARKPHAILFTYTLDVALRDEAAALARFENDQHVAITPDTSYHFVAQAPQNLTSRPIVSGRWPAG